MKDQRRSRDTLNSEACLHLQRVKDNPHFAQCRYKTVLRGKCASFESWNSGFWRKRGVRFRKQNYYWFLLQVGRMKWILYSDWLLEQASWPQRMFVPQEKSSLGHMINPLLTKLVWLRWLDISLMIFFTILLPLRLSQSIIIPPSQTNWLGHYPAIFDLTLGINTYITTNRTMDLGMWDLEIQEIYEDSEIPINVFVPQFILLSFLSPSFMKTRVILLTPATYRISIPPPCT